MSEAEQEHEPRHKNVGWKEGFVYAVCDAIINHCWTENRNKLDTQRLTKHKDVAAAARLYRLRYGMVLHALVGVLLPLNYLGDVTPFYHVAIPTVSVLNIGLAVCEIRSLSKRNFKRVFSLKPITVRRVHRSNEANDDDLTQTLS